MREKYERITKRLIEKKISVTTMESCTSGQIASLITDTEGASAVFKGAYITYSNEAKCAAGVREDTIGTFGVYSAETAAEMAQVCKEKMKADIGIGVTGTFGNADPDNADSVPGEVYFAVADRDGTETYHLRLPVLPTRLQYKMHVCDAVADRLLQKLL